MSTFRLIETAQGHKVAMVRMPTVKDIARKMTPKASTNQSTSEVSRSLGLGSQVGGLPRPTPGRKL